MTETFLFTEEVVAKLGDGAGVDSWGVLDELHRAGFTPRFCQVGLVLEVLEDFLRFRQRQPLA